MYNDIFDILDPYLEDFDAAKLAARILELFRQYDEGTKICIEYTDSSPLDHKSFKVQVLGSRRFGESTIDAIKRIKESL